MLNDISNYHVCCAYLKQNTGQSVDDMIINYNGKPSPLYVRTFYTNLEFVTKHLKGDKNGDYVSFYV